MASAQRAPQVRLLVTNERAVPLADETLTKADAAQIFDRMNSLCAFDEWRWAHANTRGVDLPVYTGSEREQNVKNSIQRTIDRLPATEPGLLTLEVRKRAVREDMGPAGPGAPGHPGGTPGHGPDYGGFETPLGPDKRLARMRGMLGRV
jgi:hypothetical protein